MLSVVAAGVNAGCLLFPFGDKTAEHDKEKGVNRILDGFSPKKLQVKGRNRSRA